MMHLLQDAWSDRAENFRGDPGAAGTRLEVVCGRGLRGSKGGMMERG